MAFFESKKTIKTAKQLSCTDCGLAVKCKNPKIEILGKGKKGILILTSNPSKEADKTGRITIPKLLSSALMDVGIKVETDCHIFPVVRCAGTAGAKQINACRHYWEGVIAETKPKKILLFGKLAVEAFLSHRTSKIGAIDKWVGAKIPDQEYKTWVYPNYGTADLHNGKSGTVFEDKFFACVKSAIEHDEPFIKDEPNVHCITDLKEAIEELEWLNDNPPKSLAFDYETTGIKPHRPEHAIKSLSFCWDSEEAVSMLMFDDWRFRDLLQSILTNTKIKKSAHNLKFEHVWTRQKLGYYVEGWNWDSMLASHVLNNCGGISGLKHQTYVRFGCIGYEQKMEQYLTKIKPGEDEKSGNRLNQIDMAPINDLLYYGGLDSLYGFKLTKIQKKEVRDKGLMEAYRLFHDGILAMAKMEEHGWAVKAGYFDKMLHHLNRVDKRNKKRILQSREAVAYKAQYEQTLNPSSNDDLKKLFFEVLEFKPVKKTAKGKASTDAETLKALENKSEIAGLILLSRKNKGLSDKIKAFQREEVAGVIHPSYNLHTVRSYRSSCNDPNMQNNPKRDKENKKMLRSGIIPRPGRMLVARDFSGVEVSTSCFYHKDPVMIKYVSNPNSDMHKDTAARLFLLDKEDVTKTLRYLAKNGFIFPQFYGDYYANCADNIWSKLSTEVLADGVPILEHLKTNKIKTYKDFETHIKEEERHFWYKKFKHYAKWKEEHWENYLINGYVEMLTGFRCTDVLTKNEAINRPIQGTAFHLLLWSVIETTKEMEGWQSYLIGQIHDDMLADVHPDELEAYIKLTEEIETVRIKNKWNWINVPLNVETEVSAIDGNWNDMEEYK